MEGNIFETIKNGIDKVKNAGAKVVNAFVKAKNFITFLATPIGTAIGIIILAIFLIFVVYVISDVVKNKIGIWLYDDYAGISTYDDFDTIIGSLGYSGYDSFISEEKWQEYAAFEYAVLMDVAEHMYDNQDFLTTLKTPNGEEYDTSAIIPEGIVHTEYDAGNPMGNSVANENWWKYWVPKAQGGSAPSSIVNKEDLQLPGGNRDVVMPRLIYEKAIHEYEDEAISLMPYLVVVREDIELNYFLQGLTEDEWKNEYSRNLEDVKVEHLENAANRNELAPVEFSPILNRLNYNMPSSAYKEDLKEYQQEKLGKDNSGEVIANEDKEGILKADEADGYQSDSIYYIEQETDIVYKIPLKLLVNRYLPKSTLLTAWYMLKRDDAEGKFEIDKMMEDIKEIYNAACYEKNSITVPEIKVTKKINDQGAIVEKFTAEDLAKLPSNKTIRVAETKSDSRTVDSVVYDKFGAIKRTESGEMIKEPKKINYATSNYGTFIYFEQFGLETSRYENYKIYLGPSGDNEPFSGDEARPEEEAPSATYLTQKRVNFIQSMNMHLSNIRYKMKSGDQIIEAEKPESVDVRLKTAYSHAEEMQMQKAEEHKVELSEKLKSLYSFKNAKTSDGSNPIGGIEILQEEPYNFMKAVVEKYESTEGDHTNEEKGGATLHFINKLYLLAEPYNYNKLMEEAGQDIVKIKQDKVEGYRLAEDYRYYNQDDKMPHWYNITGEFGITQEKFEEDYLAAFREIYGLTDYEEEIKRMLLEALKEKGIDAEEIISYGTTDSEVDYTYSGNSAPIYKDGKHNSDMEDSYTGNYQINYYWDAVYTIEEKTLQMRQAIHHRRMPAVLVKYADSWAKSTEYNNYVLQNPLDYRNHWFLIPNSVTSLGLQKMQLNEKSSFRVDTFKDYYNKSNNGDPGIKESDVLDMLVQWEDFANKGGDNTTYAYMRDLYKLTLFIRDTKQMYESAYSYLYIPSTISNYDDATLQKIFWLERLGVNQGEDELTEEEQKTMRLKAITTRWQNLEYDEYAECVYDIGEGDEDAKIYALFPYGSQYIRAYVMRAGFDSIIGQKYKGATHPAIDTTSRTALKAILNKEAGNPEDIYYYELNRLTLKYMNEGNNKYDAFMLAEEELNDYLRTEALYSPIIAIAPGRVTAIDYNARSGFYVKIAHDSGDDGEPQITSFYAHLKRWPLVEVGEVVGAGTILGYEGSTGRSTGNHLHFELVVDDVTSSISQVDPVPYLAPVFSPFYYDKKAEAIIEKDETKALGTDYYTLERTVLFEDYLFDNYFIINGMTLENGKQVTYTPTESARNSPYNSGDNAYSGDSAYDVIWGNNVPKKEIAKKLEEIIDLNLLNQSTPFEFTSGDNGDGKMMSYSKDYDVTAHPDCFSGDSNFFKEKLDWVPWFAIEMAEYKSERVVPYYNGPRSPTAEINSAEALRDLKEMQDSLRAAGYYQMAGIKWEEAGYGLYSDDFVKVVKTMQQDLIDKEYDKYNVKVTGNLDIDTVSAYNTMMQYTSEKNQFIMAEKTTYNSLLDLSIEPALLWAYARVEGDYSEDYLALKEKNASTGTVSSYYKLYPKTFNKEEGLLQINPKLAVERYKEDKIKKEDAVLFIKQPMRNTNIGAEIIKEDMMWIYDNFSGDIEKAKNDIIYGKKTSGYWYDVWKDGQKDETRWCDPENMDRLMLYALGAKMYENRSITITEQAVEETLKEPTGYALKILTEYQKYIIEKNKK